MDGWSEESLCRAPNPHFDLIVIGRDEMSARRSSILQVDANRSALGELSHDEPIVQRGGR
jgi:hypothetical protein